MIDYWNLIIFSFRFLHNFKPHVSQVLRHKHHVFLINIFSIIVTFYLLGLGDLLKINCRFTSYLLLLHNCVFYRCLFWSYRKYYHKPSELYLYLLHSLTLSKIFLILFGRKRTDNNCILTCMSIKLPSISEYFCADLIIHSFLICVFLIDRFVDSLFIDYEFVMRPKWIIENKSFLIVCVAVDYSCCFLLHFDAAFTTKLFLSLVEGSYTYPNFYWHL